jgi:tRNA (cytosine38-C5)-methyltransferase
MISLIPLVKPKLVFVENVYNFEQSKCREILVTALINIGYVIKEYMLSPIDYGIPNNRKRYYLSAYLTETAQSYPLDGSLIIKSVQDYNPDYIPTIKPLSQFILNDEINLAKPADLQKRSTNFKFDVVQSDSLYTSTFTKAYGSHHFFGSGSILTEGRKVILLNFRYTDDILSLKPRFFSPKEVSNLMGMEPRWPDNLTTRQKYMLLGNSVSVDIVGELISVMLKDANIRS